MVFSQNGTPMAIRFVVKETLISSIYTKTVSSIISRDIRQNIFRTPKGSFHPFNVDKCR